MTIGRALEATLSVDEPSFWWMHAMLSGASTRRCARRLQRWSDARGQTARHRAAHVERSRRALRVAPSAQDLTGAFVSSAR